MAFTACVCSGLSQKAERSRSKSAKYRKRPRWNNYATVWIVDQLKVQEKVIPPPLHPFKSQYIQCLAHWKHNTHIPGLHLKPCWCTQPPYATVMPTFEGETEMFLCLKPPF